MSDRIRASASSPARRRAARRRGAAAAGSVWLALAVGLLATSCRGEQDEARRAEAGAIARAVEQLREAPGAAKRPFLSALEHAPCVAPDVCRLRARCTEAYELHAHAVEALAAVRRDLRGAGDAGAGSAALLQRAEDELARASTLAGECADLEGAVRRAYRL